jgi:uncharacterized protein YecT (DUF1311 family)
LILAVVALAAASAAAASGPPVIHEPFTLLPCPKQQVSTLDLEGCNEHALVRSDARVNALAARVWRAVPGAGRPAFIRGERSWLAYRQASCEAEVARFAGGTIRPVAYLGCEISRNRAHLGELAGMLQAITHP